MDRRSSLALLFGKQKKVTTTAKTLNSITLDPYIGTWNFTHAAHLLRRTTFGPTKAQITQAVSDGLSTTIDSLFQDQPDPGLPVYYDFENDPLVPLGATWINELETSGISGLTGARKRSLYAWLFKQFRDSGSSILPKMLLFWHNHFVVANPSTGRRAFQYLNLLRENALGNFRTLVEGVTVSPAMLAYLDGTNNSANGPNENYARELLELFTIGKGALAGPGDYTNYTEDDVVAIAKALTGWRAFYDDVERDDSVPSFNEGRHEKSEKQLSHRFGNAVIPNLEAEEYKKVIDIIIEKEEVARFICRKLVRWFVHAEITSEVESNIIQPMAQLLIADNYEIKNCLMTLLSSQFFFYSEIKGCMVSHPIEQCFKLINIFDLEQPTDWVLDAKILKHYHNLLLNTDMKILSHPNVAGWKAFYQAPQFDKIWINAVSLPKRQNQSDSFVKGYNNNGFRLEIDVLSFAASMDNPVDPNSLIVEIAAVLFAHPLTQEQIVALKNILIPGLPDFEWTVEYGDYIGGNDSLEEAVEKKLKALIGAMVNMPEFYLI